ncbi:MAG: hypothetical protein KJ072_22030 [Verrucomicrobia bacterium]|nr:hypothetical protein [Verrucomicrobiota bacterium]
MIRARGIAAQMMGSDPTPGQIARVTELLLPMPDFLTQVFEELLGT